MARPPQLVTIGTDGSVTVKTVIPPGTWAICTEHAERWGVRPEQALRILLDRVESLLTSGKAGVLGPEYERAHNKLVAEDKIAVDGLPPIEAGKLHRSARTKSGFTGVYANGQGFRAMARIPDGGRIQRSIGTFRTAEQAAWARFLHYKKHRMLYGDVETALDDQTGDVAYYREVLTKQLGRDPTDLELIVEVNEARSEVNATLLPVPEGVTLPDPQFSRRRLRERDQQQGS